MILNTGQGRLKGVRFWPQFYPMMQWDCTLSLPVSMFVHWVSKERAYFSSVQTEIQFSCIKLLLGGSLVSYNSLVHPIYTLDPSPMEEFVVDPVIGSIHNDKADRGIRNHWIGALCWPVQESIFFLCMLFTRSIFRLGN